MTLLEANPEYDIYESRSSHAAFESVGASHEAGCEAGVTQGTCPAAELVVVCNISREKDTRLVRYLDLRAACGAGQLTHASPSETSFGLYLSGTNAGSHDYLLGRQIHLNTIGMWSPDADLFNRFSLVLDPFSSPQIHSADKTSIKDLIETAFSNANLDDDSNACAARARDEAVAFAERELPFANPAVDVSEDGVITLQWRQGDTGVMLVFIGDGTVAYSMKTPSSTYGSSIRELRIMDTLPATLRAAIERIDSEAGFYRGVISRALR